MIQDLKTFKQPKSFRGRGPVTVQFWWLVQSTLFACSPQFLYGWRRFLLRLFGANIGKDVLIRPSVKVTYPWKLTIGDYSWIGDEVTLYTLGSIIIGSNCVISQKSYLCTGSHDYTSNSFDIFEKQITVCDQSWISTDVFIAPGVTVNKGAVVGARSTVLSDIPELSICVGYPAKKIKNRI